LPVARGNQGMKPMSFFSLYSSRGSASRLVRLKRFWTEAILAVFCASSS
jgi:hypothetical protein